MNKSSHLSIEGNGTPLQYSCLENPMDRGAWWAAVHGVAKSQTWLSDFTFTFHFHALEKEMATHSGVLAWRIPGTGELHGLPSLGLHRVRHDWSDLAAAAATLPVLNLIQVGLPHPWSQVWAQSITSLCLFVVAVALCMWLWLSQWNINQEFPVVLFVTMRKELIWE